MADILEVIEQEQKRRAAGGAMESFVLLRNDGDEALVRFLDDLKHPKREAHVIAVHEMRGSSASDFRVVLCQGSGCRYCADGVRVTKRLLLRAFVYWVKTGGAKQKVNAVRVVDVKASSGAAADLVKDFRMRGTVTDSDYLFSRTGEGFDTKYSLRRQDKAPFQHVDKAKETWITEEKLQELVNKRYGEPEDAETDDESEIPY